MYRMNNVNESKLYEALVDTKRRSVDACAEFVDSLWGEANHIISNYTDHSLKHSLRIITRLEDLLTNRIANFLSSEEIYLLLLGAILHDIGMQCDLRKLNDVKRVAVDNFGAVFKEQYAPSAKSFSEKEQSEIRENHHLLTAAKLHCLALDSSHSNESAAIRSISNDLIEDLIDICMFHSKLPINECDMNFKHLSNGRKRLIAALVRLGDELDISSDRVNMDIPRQFMIPPENGAYWYLHNNTNVKIHKGIISVYYRVRPNETDRYEEFLQQSMVRFRNKNEHLLEILWEYDLHFRFSRTGVEYDNYAPQLDNEFVDLLVSKFEEDRNSLPIIQGVVEAISVNSAAINNVAIFEFLKSEQLSLFETIRAVYLNREPMLDNSSLSLNKILTCEENYILLGEAGFGKTYFSKYLCYEALCTLSNSQNYFPIFIDLSNYGNTYSTLGQALYRIISSKIEITYEDCDKLIANGGFYFVLDGLDEVSNDNYKKCIIELKAHIKNPQNRFFITCRTNRYFGELDENCEKIELSPLSDEQIDKFFDSHNIYKYDYQSEYDILRNPLLLSMIPSLIDDRGLLLTNKALVYKEFCAKLFDGWDAQKGDKVKFSVFDIEIFLGKIAYTYLTAPFITKSIFDSEVSKHFGAENHKYISDCIFKTALLECDNLYLKFRHKTFKEYFAANFILHNYVLSFNENELIKITQDKDYHEVNIFVTGLNPDYTSHGKYFELILDSCLKLYSECMYIRPNIQCVVSYEFESTYLNDIIITYEKILDMYFPEIKDLFSPFTSEYSQQGLDIGITGYYDEDNRSLCFSLHLIKTGDAKIKIAKLDKFFLDDYMDFAYKYNFKGSIKTRFVNLGLSGYSENSAQKIVLDIIVDELKEMLETRKLRLSKYLIASYINDFQENLRVCKDKSLDELDMWVNNELEDAVKTTGSEDVHVMHDSFNLRDLQAFINMFRKSNYLYEDCLLPKSDIQNPEHGWIWNFYSKSRAVEYLQAFFWQYQQSFVEMCDMNFSKLKSIFPDYMNYPYRYVVDITFPNVDKKDRSSDYRVSYYYQSSDIDTPPLVRENFNKNAYKSQDEIFDAIKYSYRNKPFSEVLSISNSGFSRFLHCYKNGTALVEMVFDKLEDNLKNVFGKVWS